MNVGEEERKGNLGGRKVILEAQPRCQHLISFAQKMWIRWDMEMNEAANKGEKDVTYTNVLKKDRTLHITHYTMFFSRDLMPGTQLYE